MSLRVFPRSEYKDIDRDGRFLLAGILGSAQMDNSKGDFWDESKNVRKDCQIQYWETVQNDKHQYVVNLRVSHYCTMSEDMEMLNFDLSIDPAKVCAKALNIIVNTIGIHKFAKTIQKWI